MKRRDLVKLFEKKGWHFKRDGGSHEVWTNGEKNGRNSALP